MYNSSLLESVSAETFNLKACLCNIIKSEINGYLARCCFSFLVAISFLMEECVFKFYQRYSRKWENTYN